jgi:hypothetical protein
VLLCALVHHTHDPAHHQTNCARDLIAVQKILIIRHDVYVPKISSRTSNQIKGWLQAYSATRAHLNVRTDEVVWIRLPQYHVLERAKFNFGEFCARRLVDGVVHQLTECIGKTRVLSHRLG